MWLEAMLVSAAYFFWREIKVKRDMQDIDEKQHMRSLMI